MSGWDLRGPGCRALSQFAVLALWTGAWNPDLKQPPGPLGWAGSKLAGPAHSQQDREPETAGDGETSLSLDKPEELSVWDFPCQPCPWRGADWGEATGLFWEVD